MPGASASASCLVSRTGLARELRMRVRKAQAGPRSMAGWTAGIRARCRRPLRGKTVHNRRLRSRRGRPHTRLYKELRRAGTKLSRPGRVMRMLSLAYHDGIVFGRQSPSATVASRRREARDASGYDVVCGSVNGCPREISSVETSSAACHGSRSASVESQRRMTYRLTARAAAREIH